MSSLCAYFFCDRRISKGSKRRRNFAFSHEPLLDVFFFYLSNNRLARWKDYVGIGEQWGLQGGFVEVDGCAKEAALWHPWESSLESPAVSFVFVFVFVSGAPRGIWANKTC